MARELSEKRGIEEIQNQINWIDQRNPKQSRLGMLRKAIEENWSEPVTKETIQKEQRVEKNRNDSVQQMAAENKKRKDRRKQQIEHWNQLPDSEKSKFYESAIEQATSALVQSRLTRNRDLKKPPIEVLTLMNNFDKN